MYKPRTGYDAIIVGAGLHGLATACQEAERHGLTDVAVLDRGHVAQGLAVRAHEHGVDLIPGCEVTEILLHRGRVVGVETTHGCIEAPHVVLAASGDAVVLADAVGVNLPRHGLEGHALPTRLEGLFVSDGWSTGGLQATPGAGREARATLVAH